LVFDLIIRQSSWALELISSYLSMFCKFSGVLEGFYEKFLEKQEAGAYLGLFSSLKTSTNVKR
jgi:hypothetical protein